MSNYAVFRDSHSHCCLRVAEKNGRVEYITIIEDNSEMRIDVLKMDAEEFYAEYKELPNYPVKRAAEHYRNPITAAITVSDKAMTHLSNISGETPMNTEATATVATETKKPAAPKKAVPAPAKKAAPAPAKKAAPAPTKGGTVISTKPPTEAAKKNVAATARASIKDGAEPKAAPVVRKQPTKKEQEAAAKKLQKEKDAAKAAAVKEKQQAKEDAAATKAAAKNKVSPAKLKQAREAAAKTKPKAKTPPAKAAKLVRNPNHKPAEKAAPKKGAAKKEAGGNRSSFSDNQTIKILVDKNPKREGSNAYDIFELLKKSKTVGDFYKKGGASTNLRWNIDHGYISVK